MKKIYLIGLLFLLSNFSMVAQNEMKYKELIEIVRNTDDVIAYQTLTAYVGQCKEPEPELLNAYYRLALICYSWANKYDPLKETHDVFYFTDLAVVMLDSAKANMNEKKFKKTRKYFDDLTKASDSKLKPEDILNDINIKKTKITDFKLKISEIVSNFNAAADKYDKCLTIFRDINGRYSELNDVYMMFDDNLKAQTEELRIEFDSVLFYFDRYKKNITDYPIKNYKQTYSLKPIVIYRLDGLTNSSFFDDNIQLWDYRTWVADLHKAVDEKIIPLRQKIADADKRINSEYQLVKSGRQKNEDAEMYELSQQLMYAVSRFDSRHLVFDILKYKKQKIKLLALLNDSINTGQINPQLLSGQKARRQYKLLTEKQICDSLLSELRAKSVTNETNYLKYKQLFDAEYGDYQGLVDYEKREFEENQNIINQSFAELRRFLDNYQNRFLRQDSFITYRNRKIPLFITPLSKISESEAGQFYSTDISEDDAGNLYIAGYLQDKEDQRRAFIAKTDKLDKIVWLKYFNFKSPDKSPMNNTALKIEAFDNGCYAVVHAKSGAQLQNTALKISRSGQVQAQEVLTDYRLPADIYYDDVNGVLLLSFKGYKFVNKYEAEEKLMIHSYTPDLKTMNWETTVSLTGNLLDIIKTGRYYTAICNYKSYVDKKGKRHISKTGLKSTNVLSFNFTEKGFLLNHTLYESKVPILANQVVKIDSERIQITGNLPETNEFLYLIIDKNGRLKFTNQDTVHSLNK